MATKKGKSRRPPPTPEEQVIQTLKDLWRESRRKYELRCGFTRSPKKGILEFLITPDDTEPLVSVTRQEDGTLTISTNSPKWKTQAYHLPDPWQKSPGPASLKLPPWHTNATRWAATKVFEDYLENDEVLHGTLKDSQIQTIFGRFRSYAAGTLSRNFRHHPQQGDSPEKAFAERLTTEVLNKQVFAEIRRFTKAKRMNIARYNQAVQRLNAHKKPAIGFLARQR